MALYCVTQYVDDNYGLDHVQRFKTRPPADVLLDTHRRASRFARLVQWDGGTQFKELAHVRNGILYDGLDSKIDWADLGQVVEVWERAKEEIRERLDGPRIDLDFFPIIRSVVRERCLPEEWVDRLRDVIKDESLPRTVNLS